MNFLPMNVRYRIPISCEFAKVNDHLQCSEEFSNEEEFISQIVIENNDPVNVPDEEQA